MPIYTFGSISHKSTYIVLPEGLRIINCILYNQCCTLVANIIKNIVITLLARCHTHCIAVVECFCASKPCIYSDIKLVSEMLEQF